MTENKKGILIALGIAAAVFAGFIWFLKLLLPRSNIRDLYIPRVGRDFYTPKVPRGFYLPRGDDK